MKNEHVYGKRNKARIFLRSFGMRFYKKLGTLVHSSSTNDKLIVIYPVFETLESLANTLNKFYWAFPEPSGIKIIYSIKPGLNIENADLSKYLNKQGSYFKNNPNIVQVSAAELKNSLKDAKLIAIQDKNAKYSASLLPYLNKCKVIDAQFYSLEESNFWKFGYYDMLNADERNYYKKLSLDNFIAFKKIHEGKKKTNIFLTGPSYNSYTDFTFGNDSMKIICNTIVKDVEFLEYIGGPDIITFADPAFHFSTADYAHEFRRLVMNTVEKYGSFIAVPASTVPLMLGNYPQLRDKIIGLRRSELISFPTEANLSVKPSGSIITFIMLPLATSLADEIYVLGADGRGNNENYFWKHNEKVQLEELMESVFVTHPSFFRDRDYADHYQQHCDFIEELITRGEAEGKKYYSLTESFIPALKSRHYTEK